MQHFWQTLRSLSFEPTGFDWFVLVIVLAFVAWFWSGLLAGNLRDAIAEHTDRVCRSFRDHSLALNEAKEKSDREATTAILAYQKIRQAEFETPSNN